MASNSTTLSSGGGSPNAYTLSISWSENSTSVANNTSNITATATLSKYYNIYWVTNAGVLRCYWHDNHDNTNRLIAESVIEEVGYENNSQSVGGTFNATHNDDGTLSGYAWAQWELTNNYKGYPPASGSVATETVALTTIARASAPTMSASSITVPASSGTITVNTNRASSSFTHTITLKVGNTTIATYTGVGASKAINIADIDDAILATIPSATTATVSVDCQTFSGSTSVGTKSTSFTANVGSGAKPTFSNFTFADTNSTTTGITGNNQVMISGKSATRVTISAANKATAKYSATMVKYTFAIAGLSAEQAYSTSQIAKDLGSPTVANTELPSGTRDLVVTAIDSRGLSTSVTKTVTIVPYQAPTINASATRANGFEDTTTVKIAGAFSRIEVNGTAKNTVNTSTGVAYRYKPQSSTSWTIDWTNKTATVNTANGTVTVADFTHELDNQTAYDFQFRITDKFTSSPSTASLVVSIGQPAFYIGTDGRAAVGGMPTVSKKTGEAGLLQVMGRIFADNIYPVGSIYMSTTMTTASQVNAALGGTWVAWGKGKVPVGVDTSDTDFSTVEQTGGSKSMQKHSHTRGTMEITGSVYGDEVSRDTSVDASGAFRFPSTNDGTGGKGHFFGSSYNYYLANGFNFKASRSWTGATSEEGTGESGNLQPYITCYMYKRTA